MAHPAHTNTLPYFFHHLPLSFAPIPMPASIALPPDPAPPMTLYQPHEPLLDFDLSFSPAVTPDLLPANAFLLEPLDLLEPPMPTSSPSSSSSSSPSSATAKPARPRLRNFQCTHPGCGKSFADNAHLKDHMFVHTGEKSLQCPECDKCFARVASLRSHRRVHTGERPFLCPEPDCDKQYASRAALRMHASLHAAAAKKKQLPKKASTSSSSAKPSTIKLQKIPASTTTTPHGHDANCDDCSDCHHGRCRQLADKIKEQRQVILDLQAQLQSQAGSSPEKKRVQPKPPPASSLDKEPVLKSPPVVPMVAPLYLLQDGIKPFKCMLGCGRVFSNYFQLAFHAKQHPEADAADVLGDQLPFPVGPKYCPVKGCEFSEESGKSMKTLQIVKRHWQRVHQNTRPFLCPDCPSHAQKAFKTRDNLTAHRKECKKRDSKASPSKRAASPLSSPKKRLKPSAAPAVL